MEKWKALAKKFLFPPLWLALLLILVSAALLVAVFVKGWEASPLAYASYVLAFYTLTVVCMACCETFPKAFRNIKQKIYENKFGNRYMTDAAFKTHVSLYRSLSINLLYVVFNLISGLLYRSAWFYVLAGYYSILAVMRFLLLRYVNRNQIGERLLGELKRSRLCAWILLTVNLVLSGAVLMILYENKGFEYHGILIYVMAAYTFYITTTAVIDLVKYRKYNSPIMMTSKVIKLAAALVSMLSLETVMLTQFGGDNSPEFRRTMVAATGGGVSLIIIAMALYMILRAGKQMKKLKQEEQDPYGTSE